MLIGDIILQYCRENDLNQSEFAKKCGLTKGYISMLVSGKNPQTGKPFKRISGNTLASIAGAMGIGLNELIEKMDNIKVDTAPQAPIIPNRETYPYTPARAMVPIAGSVRCGYGGLAYQDLQGAEVADVANPQEYFYLRAVGDSMAPLIMQGDLVLIHIQEEIESGEIAVVVIGEEEGTLKKVNTRPGAVTLMPLNNAYTPSVYIGEEMRQVKVIGKAVKVVRNLA